MQGLESGRLVVVPLSEYRVEREREYLEISIGCLWQMLRS